LGPLQGQGQKKKKKKLNDAFKRLIYSIWAKVNLKEVTSLTSGNQTLINLIYVQEGFDSSTYELINFSS
jgi:hypothetical protein